MPRNRMAHRLGVKRERQILYKGEADHDDKERGNRTVRISGRRTEGRREGNTAKSKMSIGDRAPEEKKKNKKRKKKEKEIKEKKKKKKRKKKRKKKEKKTKKKKKRKRKKEKKKGRRFGGGRQGEREKENRDVRVAGRKSRNNKIADKHLKEGERRKG